MSEKELLKNYLEKLEKEEKKVTFEDIQKANETIKTTDIKGKEYAEVNQRIKAFRSVYPNGSIITEIIQNLDGVCICRAEVRNEDGDVIATGTAYEKENSTFINKTSYIENCETSAVGRALGMAGFGIDTSVASAEEVANAIENQNLTLEEAKEYVLNFGKHKGKKLTEVDEGYLAWLYNANKADETIKKAIELLNQEKTDNDLSPYDFMLDEEIQKEKLELISKLNDLMLQTNQDHDKLYQHYKVNEQKEMSIEQLKDAISKLEKKVG